MTARSLLFSLLRDGRGNVLVLASLTLPLLVGGAGLAMDTIQLTLLQRQLQRQADSAALSGAFAKAQGASAATAANASIGRDNLVALSKTPVVESAPTAGPYAGNAAAVRVILETTKAMPFSNTFLGKPTIMTVEATAASLTNGNYCIVSLESGNTAGITMQGSSTVQMGCGLATNSKASPAVAAGGSTQVFASHISAVGGLKNSANFASGTVLLPYSIPQKDPFASLPAPIVPSTCNAMLTVQPNTTVNVGPGCYRGMDIKGTVNFAPGIYYIDGATNGNQSPNSVGFGSQAVVKGNGVTFILTSSSTSTTAPKIATLGMNGGATVQLTATTTGTYAGVLFYQDRRAASGTTNSVNGNANSKFQGAFYFPRQDLSFSGDSAMDTDCVQLVSRRVTFTGNTGIVNVCPDDSGAGSFIGTRVYLVG